MEQVCNLVYHTLMDGRTQAQAAELHMLLSDPKDREKMREKQNAIAMQSLGMVGMIGPPPGGPPRPRPRPSGQSGVPPRPRDKS